MSEAWRPDVLGAGFEQRTLPLGTDSEGEVVATLVRHLPRGLRRAGELRDVDVLYVHGWSDYFFQRRLARFWADRGARFFALDLRKYGRSLRHGQRLGFVADLATYDEDIEAALEAMGDRRGRRLVLFGHSTGGLTLSLWAARHRELVDALVLNAPWLEFQFGFVGRAALAPALGLGARFRPHDPVPQVDLGFYSRAQEAAADPDDPMEPDPRWRPHISAPASTAWLDAVLAGHATVARGLELAAPVCVLLSARSILPTRWSDELSTVDTVLQVDAIARAALKLGASVTVERIAGALHDVFISHREARDEAYARLDRWTDGYLSRDSRRGGARP
ncbi:alpha/beta hydrolase [Microbacterium sp. Marseille-Q6965]|uniref:alpha/beta hydrolase n=1 Tax=Microbacterium sp. Marseille-Q6965 TaxID=2965072 RepID=UPI0021B7E011|nr:alpha/beta hydrolase [Microbacterium sp. Marseille-Q6965]